MSAFAVIYDRSNAPVEPGALERVMERMGHRGPDGKDIYLAGHVALGHWHFWTTPEEVGERQPLELAGLPYKIVLDGRLDNRADLIRELHINPVEGNRLSDAALILHSYERWGEHCCEHFIGPFALVILDERLGGLLCARDALGDRTLFYSNQGTRLVIASEPWAVAGAQDGNPELDDVGVAHFFALESAKDGRTFFENIRELLPAQVLAVNLAGERHWQYWQADPAARIRCRTDEEYAAHFLALLKESVDCRLRSSTPVGVLMSGGLDSTSVASLAARTLAPSTLATFSYVFDELPDCDERQYINAMQARWGLRSVQLPCDDLWPLKDWSQWPRNPNLPEGNLYRLIKERTYQRVKQDGVRVLLTGGFGDQLYIGAEDWLADLIAEGQLVEAGRELFWYLRHIGLRRTLRAGYLQQAARRALPASLRGIHFHRRSAEAPWLTASAARLLCESGDATRPLSDRQDSLTGLWTAQDSSAEIFNASRHGLELRHPYRDRRLIEFVLALPAHQLLRFGYYKHILRNAMQGLLPEIIRTRPRPTSLNSLFIRGMEREKAVQQACFLDPQAAWRKFVEGSWIASRWNVIPAEDGNESLVPWLCLAYETWHNNLSYCDMQGIIKNGV